MKWMMQKGIKCEEVCPQCHGTFSSDDYDYEEDMCIYCLFPETPKSKPVELDYSYGEPRNSTKEAQLLDQIDYIPEKQSKQAQKSKLVYDYSKKKRKV
jgi:hypothetical protein